MCDLFSAFANQNFAIYESLFLLEYNTQRSKHYTN